VAKMNVIQTARQRPREVATAVLGLVTQVLAGVCIETPVKVVC